MFFWLVFSLACAAWLFPTCRHLEKVCRTASDGWYFQVNDECAVLVMVLFIVHRDRTKILGISLVNLVHFSCFICEIEHDCLVYSWAELVAKFFVFVFFLYVGDAGNTSLVDAGTPLGATAVVTPGSAGYLLWECCILASL